ncbi:MAG TPA: NADH-quinone oxidoreductase subunit NuoN [Stellaceae bacterium]|jgi:NADH-quinone oxidoreductase subunit N|nr:NADH-quinone oxidoreductase subunit NuoN [Stellaceae bacterium]
MHLALPDFMAALPEVFLAAASLALLVLGAFQGDKAAREIAWLAVAALVVAFALVASPLYSHGPARQVALFGLFVVDGFGAFSKMLVLIGSALTLILAMRFNEREGIARPEYAVLVLLATTGMMMMIAANDLISLYVSLELQSLALYVVAAFHRDDRRSTEAGLKYFVLGALASGMLLYGSSMVYGFAGTTSFDTLAHAFADGGTVSIGLIIGIVLISVGLAFKVSAVPFHMWTPDVYEGAPTPVTAFFSVAPKVAALALFVRVMVGPFGGLVTEWRQVIWFISVASMLLGAFAAINQSNIKRLMAYSSIANVGYALIGLAAGSAAGVRGILVYLAIYVFMNAGAFAVILCMRRNGKPVEGINDLAGLSRTHPALALALGIFMFSLAGIPPMAGFFGKLYIFLAAIDAQLYVLAVIGVLSSVVGAYYYLRIVKLMYFDEPAGAFDRPFGREVQMVVAVSALVVFFFFAWPGLLVDGADAVAAALFTG